MRDLGWIVSRLPLGICRTVLDIILLSFYNEVYLIKRNERLSKGEDKEYRKERVKKML